MQDQIKKRLSAKPFVPFTVCMSDGKEYSVRHPENCVLTKHFLIVYDPTTEEVDDLYLLHVVAIERNVSV